MQLGYRTTRALRWHPVMAAEVESLLDERSRHIEAFVSLTSFLPLRAPLPPMGGFALGADLAVEIVTHVLALPRERPCPEAGLALGVRRTFSEICGQIGSARSHAFHVGPSVDQRDGSGRGG